MGYIPQNEPDLFAVLFWGTHLLAGKRSYQLGEITTEYLNLDSQTVREFSERVDVLAPAFITSWTSRINHWLFPFRKAERILRCAAVPAALS